MIAHAAEAKERHMGTVGLRSASTAIILVMLAQAAEAHVGPGAGSGFWSGILHPITGWDHVVAMVAVGLWGAFLERLLISTQK